MILCLKFSDFLFAKLINCRIWKVGHMYIKPNLYFFIFQVQFAILIFHFARPILNPNCGYPKCWLILGVTQNLFMFVLFGDFYIRTYMKKPRKEEAID